MVFELESDVFAGRFRVYVIGPTRRFEKGPATMPSTRGIMMPLFILPARNCALEVK